MNFLKNIWYAAAWTKDVVQGTPVARTIIEQPILLLRDSAGVAFALRDACPHRFAPLSMGRQEGDTIRCGYHGIAFNLKGKCVENPHGPVLQSLCAKSHPLVERHKLLWVWLGDPAAADPALIPDFDFIDRSSEHSIVLGYLKSKANHHLIEDNILDLSHTDYLHADTLGGGANTRSKISVKELGEKVQVNWHASNEVPPPIIHGMLPDPAAGYDQWTEVLWHPNGSLHLFTKMGIPEGPALDHLATWNAHILVPEDASTTHYFYASVRAFATDDPHVNEVMGVGLRNAFENEDRPMLEAQQRVIGDRNIMDMKPALLSIDNGSTRARRIYDRLLSAEQSATEATAEPA